MPQPTDGKERQHADAVGQKHLRGKSEREMQVQDTAQDEETRQNCKYK
jgi:hypothetical protein